MDEQKNNEIDKYLENLPDNVVDLVHDKVWPKRVDEIAAKYSLNDEQKAALQDIVLFVLVGMESPETFGASLETELGISKLLAEQILTDLDTRVFQYATEFITKQNETGGTSQPAAETKTSAFDVLNKQTQEKPGTEMETPPVVLPMVESGEQRQKVMDENKIPPTSQTQDGTFVGAEFVQKPIAVPRFNASAPAPATATPARPAAQNIIDTKLNSVVSSAAPQNPRPEIQNPPRYTVDPYREPIE